MWYNFKRHENIFTITNTFGGHLSASLSKQDPCNNEFLEVLPPKDIEDYDYIHLPLEDGIYKITLTQDSKEVSFTIPHYENLLCSIIEDIDYTLCGCPCEDCDDCSDKDEKSTLTLMLKMISYYTITNNFYSDLLSKIFECLKCGIVDANQCVLLNEKVYGNAENTLLLKKIISLYYLTFYYREYYAIEDKTYLNEKFKFEKVIKCIEKLGISLNCINKTIKENMAIFKITSTAYINKPPTHVGNISIDANNRATTILTAAMFTSSTTPPYSDPEGDAADAVKIESLPATGQLTFNDTPVTIGQIITIEDINGNKLKYISPNQNEESIDTFNFSVRDAGSMTFVSK